MHQLLDNLIIPAFSNGLPVQRHDGAVLTVGGVKLAFTTDSYVVHPLFFPGGDIGQLAVHGTVNDLAMCGPGPCTSPARLSSKKACRSRFCGAWCGPCRRRPRLPAFIW